MSETEKLIELVRERPFLYDGSYLKRAKKAEAWLEIAKEMGAEDGLYWNKKWKNLKHNYGRFLKATQTSSGQIYKRYRNWPWAHLMRFLDDDDIEFGSETNIHTTEETNCSDFLWAFSEKSNATCSSSEVREVPLENDTPCSNKKRKATNSEESTDKILEYLKNNDKQNQQRTLDEADYFFMSYAQCCKKFSPRAQAMLKLDIAKVFVRYELQAAKYTKLTPQSVQQEQWRTTEDGNF